MQESINKGRSRAITDIGYSLMNKACGPALWEKDPEKKAHNLGKGCSEKILVYMDQKLTGSQVTKVEVSGPGGAPLVRSLAELMALGGTDEEGVKEQGKKRQNSPLI